MAFLDIVLNSVLVLDFKITLFLEFFVTNQTVQHNAYDQDPYAKEFGIKISEKLASVEARILPAPWVRQPVFIICE